MNSHLAHDNRKPNLFIASSREAMPLARAMHEQLRYHMQVTPWYAGTFQANEYTMESLERQLDQSDYGVFVFSPDDVALLRGKPVFLTRDNTLFEMGLFWGKLRRSRVFAVLPTHVKERTDWIPGLEVKEYHLLSDLQGLTLLTYEERSDGNWTAAVDIACSHVLQAAARLGTFADPSQLLEMKELELLQKQSVLHFFWEYNRNIHVTDQDRQYQALSEAVRNSLIPPDGYRVTGAAFWEKQGSDGMAQVGGNVGKGRFFRFADYPVGGGGPPIYVLDVYFSGRWTFFKRREVAQVYVLCYPLGKEHVLTVHLMGREELSEYEQLNIVQVNDDLLTTIRYLIGGDSG